MDIERMKSYHMKAKRREFATYKSSEEKSKGVTLDIIDYENNVYYKDTDNKVYNLDMDVVGLYRENDVHLNDVGSKQQQVKSSLDKAMLRAQQDKLGQPCQFANMYRSQG